jgi:phage-related tail protein
MSTTSAWATVKEKTKEFFDKIKDINVFESISNGVTSVKDFITNAITTVKDKATGNDYDPRYDPYQGPEGCGYSSSDDDIEYD